MAGQTRFCLFKQVRCKKLQRLVSNLRRAGENQTKITADLVQISKIFVKILNIRASNLPMAFCKPPRNQPCL